MMEILNFMFSTIWHFLGMVIIISLFIKLCKTVFLFLHSVIRGYPLDYSSLEDEDDDEDKY